MVHWLFGEALIDERIQNPDRFRIGNLLPDAYGDPALRRTTHFVKPLETNDGSLLRFCDFPSFTARFGDLVFGDDLYLGYVMHLLEDAVTRAFWKREKFRVPGTPEGVARLHSDYHLFNRFLVETHHLRFSACMPEGFEKERILEICPFDLEGLLREFEKDFSDPAEGELQILSRPLMERMIAEAVPVLKTALTDLITENRLPEPTMYVW